MRLLRCGVAVTKRDRGKTKSTMRRSRGIKTMRGTPYPIGELTASLTALGFTRVEFRIFAVSSNGDMHPFVFATR